MQPLKLKIDGLTRLDVTVALSLEISRTQAQKAIKAGFILVDGYKRSPHFLVDGENEITYDPEAFQVKESKPLKPPVLTVLYEDADLMVIDKPAGLLVHKTATSHESTVVDGIIALHPEIEKIGEHADRPGIVHRLDKFASGVLVVAKTQTAFDYLKQEFKSHHIKKFYTVLAKGTFSKPNDTITLAIARSKHSARMAARPIQQEGKSAITHHTVLTQYAQYALLDVEIETGRTHQIRAHLFAIEHPVVGDRLYAPKYQKPEMLHRLFLHARSLELTLPNGEKKIFESPLPQELKDYLSTLAL
ncbi:MAG: RluA family pseudouridine synthase [Patescibacteria group bacterium]|jgi:23S rRNA pseudouridine1911/1915/1917 synthase